MLRYHSYQFPYLHQQITISTKTRTKRRVSFKKGYGYLLEEKDIKNKLFDLIRSIFKDKSSIKNIISKQRQHSDKDVFINLNNQIEKIIDEKN